MYDSHTVAVINHRVERSVRHFNLKCIFYWKHILLYLHSVCGLLERFELRINTHHLYNDVHAVTDVLNCKQEENKRGEQEVTSCHKVNYKIRKAWVYCFQTVGIIIQLSHVPSSYSLYPLNGFCSLSQGLLFIDCDYNSNFVGTHEISPHVCLQIHTCWKYEHE